MLKIIQKLVFVCSCKYDPIVLAQDDDDDVPGPHVPDGAAEDAQAETEDGHVAEVEAGLEQSVHPANSRHEILTGTQLMSDFVLKKK